jgi:hypothetical protein
MGETEAPILGDVDAGKVFRTCNGTVLRNLFELKNWLDGCSDYDFRYHVNNDHHKNDFAIWVREVVQDETLARELDAELDKERYCEKIRRRMRTLHLL